MKRREFFAKAGVGSAAMMSLPVLGGRPATAARGQTHGHEAVTGPLATATVTFGGWQTSPPFDRFVALNDRFRNHHAMTPAECKIKAGGTVNFVIGGFHLLLVYGDGTQPEQINPSLLIISAGTPPAFPPLMNDAANRIYRGIDPRLTPAVQDRVESVHFADPGTYLVICGVLPHFVEGMVGYVRVVA
jgi:plastocyanin